VNTDAASTARLPAIDATPPSVVTFPGDEQEFDDARQDPLVRALRSRGFLRGAVDIAAYAIMAADFGEDVCATVWSRLRVHGHEVGSETIGRMLEACWLVALLLGQKPLLPSAPTLTHPEEGCGGYRRAA